MDPADLGSGQNRPDELDFAGARLAISSGHSMDRTVALHDLEDLALGAYLSEGAVLGEDPGELPDPGLEVQLFEAPARFTDASVSAPPEEVFDLLFADLFQVAKELRGQMRVAAGEEGVAPKGQAVEVSGTSRPAGDRGGGRGSGRSLPSQKIMIKNPVRFRKL